MERDASEYGAAMVAAARMHASNFVQRADGTVEFNAWWRGGEALKVRVWPWKGAWCDIKAHALGDGGKGNCANFARALGLDLPEFMRRYGPEATGESVLREPRKHQPDPPQATWPNGAAHQCWVDHVLSTQPSEMASVAAWVRRTRGLPAPPRSGMVPFKPLLVPEVAIPGAEPGRPQTVREWCTEMVERGGPAVLLPLWNAGGVVEGLVMRFLTVKPGGKKSLNLKGLRRHRERPVAFGCPQRLHRSWAAVVVEGAPDCWAAEAVAAEHLCDPRKDERNGMAVLGVDGIGQMREWVRPVRESGVREVVLVPQMDEQSLGGMHAFALEMGKAGIPARMVAWEILLLGALGCGVADRPAGLKDLADLTREATHAGWALDLVMGAFWESVRQARAVDAAEKGGERGA